MRSDFVSTIYGPISSDYVESCLEDLCIPKIGVQTGPFGSQLHASDYIEDGTPIITVEHLGDNRIIHTNVPCISDEDKERLAKYTLKTGDIVFSRVGSVDRRAYVHSEEEGWLFSGRCLRVRPNPERISPKYLSWFMGLPSFKEHIRQIAVGATMPSLNTTILSNIIIYYPPSIKEQQAIAAILGALDDKIELNRRMNQTLEEIARAIFKSWFVDFDPVRYKAAGQQPPGLAPHIADLFPDRFEDSELGEIPAGWRILSVSDIAGINTLTLSRKDTLDIIDYVEISKVMRGEIAEITSYKRGDEPSRARRKLRHGDTVISTVRPDRGAHFLALYPPESMIASTGFTVISPNKNWWGFIYSMLTRPEVGLELGRLADGGAYPAIRPEIIGNLKLPLPNDIRLIHEFEQIAQPIYEKVHRNRLVTRTLTKIRDTLLPKLISGEIRVKV